MVLMIKDNLYKRLGCMALACFFALTSVLGPGDGWAAGLVVSDQMQLPEPGAMVGFSRAVEPPVLKGVSVYANEPLRFDFMLDQGSDVAADDQALREQANRLVRYFMAAVTVPENDLWVNLSPYEANRIIPDALGQTDMGRDLLAQDYILKQITASALHPDTALGREFWDKVYAQAAAQFGAGVDIPVDTFNKVWVMPDKAVVYESAESGKERISAVVVESRLKVMLEADYLAANLTSEVSNGQTTSEVGKAVLRQVILPLLEKEINQGANFAPLRQVYQSIILAAWYKRKIKDSLLASVYADQRKVKGVTVDDPRVTQMIYNEYVAAFRKGVFNLIKEERDRYSDEIIPRKYFSGGMGMALPGIEISSADSRKASVDSMLSSLGQAGRLFNVRTQQKPMDSAERQTAWRSITDQPVVSMEKALDIPEARKILQQRASSGEARILSYLFYRQQSGQSTRVEMFEANYLLSLDEDSVTLDVRHVPEKGVSIAILRLTSEPEGQAYVLNVWDVDTSRAGIEGAGVLKAMMSHISGADKVRIKTVTHRETNTLLRRLWPNPPPSILKPVVFSRLFPHAVPVLERDTLPHDIVLYQTQPLGVLGAEIDALLRDAQQVDALLAQGERPEGLKALINRVSALSQRVRARTEYPHASAVADALDRQTAHLEEIEEALQALNVRLFGADQSRMKRAVPFRVSAVQGREGFQAVYTPSSPMKHQVASSEVLVTTEAGVRVVRAHYELKRGVPDALYVSSVNSQDAGIQGRGFLKKILGMLAVTPVVRVCFIENNDTYNVIKNFSNGAPPAVLELTKIGHLLPSRYMPELWKGKEHDDIVFLDTALLGKELSGEIMDVMARAREAVMSRWQDFRFVNFSSRDQVRLKALYPIDKMEALSYDLDALAEKVSAVSYRHAPRIAAALNRQAQYCRMQIAQEVLDMKTIAQQAKDGEMSLNSRDFSFDIFGKNGAKEKFSLTYTIRHHEGVRVHFVLYHKATRAKVLEGVYERFPDGNEETALFEIDMDEARINGNGMASALLAMILKTPLVKTHWILNPETLAVIQGVSEDTAPGLPRSTLLGRIFPSHYVPVLRKEKGDNYFLLYDTTPLAGLSPKIIEVLTHAMEAEKAFAAPGTMNTTEESQVNLRAFYSSRELETLARESLDLAHRVSLVKTYSHAPAIAAALKRQASRFRELTAFSGVTDAAMIPAHEYKQEALDIPRVASEFVSMNEVYGDGRKNTDGGVLAVKEYVFSLPDREGHEENFIARYRVVNADREAEEMVLDLAVLHERTAREVLGVSCWLRKGKLFWVKVNAAYFNFASISGRGLFKLMLERLVQGASFVSLSKIRNGQSSGVIKMISQKPAHSQLGMTLLVNVIPNGYIAELTALRNDQNINAYSLVPLGAALTSSIADWLNEASRVERGYWDMNVWEIRLKEGESQEALRAQYPRQRILELARVGKELEGQVKDLTNQSEFADSIASALERQVVRLNEIADKAEKHKPVTPKYEMADLFEDQLSPVVKELARNPFDLQAVIKADLDWKEAGPLQVAPVKFDLKPSGVKASKSFEIMYTRYRLRSGARIPEVSIEIKESDGPMVLRAEYKPDSQGRGVLDILDVRDMWWVKPDAEPFREALLDRMMGESLVRMPTMMDEQSVNSWVKVAGSSAPSALYALPMVRAVPSRYIPVRGRGQNRYDVTFVDLSPLGDAALVQKIGKMLRRDRDAKLSSSEAFALSEECERLAGQVNGHQEYRDAGKIADALYFEAADLRKEARPPSTRYKITEGDIERTVEWVEGEFPQAEEYFQKLKYKKGKKPGLTLMADWPRLFTEEQMTMVVWDEDSGRPEGMVVLSPWKRNFYKDGWTLWHIDKMVAVNPGLSRMLLLIAAERVAGRRGGLMVHPSDAKAGEFFGKRQFWRYDEFGRRVYHHENTATMSMPLFKVEKIAESAPKKQKIKNRDFAAVGHQQGGVDMRDKTLGLDVRLEPGSENVNLKSRLDLSGYDNVAGFTPVIISIERM